MKRILFLLISLLCMTGVWAQQQESAFLKTFEYDKRIHDFGTIEEAKGKVKHTFTFTNNSQKNLIISDVNAWCGCTTAEFTKSMIKPGQKATVTVTYDPSYRPGKFSKEVVVMLNNGKYYTRIWVKGNVIGMKHPVTEDHPYAYGEGLYMSHQIVPFPSIQKGEKDSVRVLIANDTDKEMTVELIRRPNNRILQMPRKIVLKAGERTKFYAKYRAPRKYKHRRYIHVIPKVNGKELKPLKVTWLPNE